MFFFTSFLPFLRLLHLFVILYLFVSFDSFDNNFVQKSNECSLFFFFSFARAQHMYVQRHRWKSSLSSLSVPRHLYPWSPLTYDRVHNMYMQTYFLRWLSIVTNIHPSILLTHATVWTYTLLCAHQHIVLVSCYCVHCIRYGALKR